MRSISSSSAHQVGALAHLEVPMLHQMRREPEQVVELVSEMHTLAIQGGLPYRQATAGVLLGWARSALGESAAGCHDLEAALAGYRRTGAASELPYFLILYAATRRATQG
jgi:hypothetical protein